MSQFDEIRNLASQHKIFLTEDFKISELGLDFRVVFAKDLTGQEWILRIPRRSDVYSKIEREGRILDFLKRRVSFDVPDWRIISNELIAYPLLAGKPAFEIDPSTGNQIWNVDLSSQHYGRSLAKINSELHQLSISEAIKYGLKFNDHKDVRKILKDQIYLVKKELGLKHELEYRWMTWIDDDSYWPTFMSVIHGDLYAGHTLVNEQQSITGVIDWTEAEVSDPSIDFVGYAIVFGIKLLDELLGEYAKNGGRVWPRMNAHIQERMSAAPLKFAIFALETTNDQMIVQAKKQLN